MYTTREMQANGTHKVIYGTISRGRGTKMHAGQTHWFELDGEISEKFCGSSCNGSSNTRNGRHWDFEEGFERTITCKSCIKDDLQGRVTA